MTVFALIGAKGLYLLFLWLLSAAGSAWIADRKGYGERVGLTFGLLLSVIGFVIVLLLLPSRPGSAWRVEGWLPTRRPGAGLLGGPTMEARGPGLEPKHGQQGQQGQQGQDPGGSSSE
jgi:hypothetical protein